MVRTVALAAWVTAIGLAPGAIHSDEIALLSDPASWGADISSRLSPSPGCPSISVTDLGKRLGVSAPHSLAEFEKTVQSQSIMAGKPRRVETTYHSVSAAIRPLVTERHRLHMFYFSSNPANGPYWGFSGYLVAEEGCVVHAEINSFDNQGVWLAA